MRLPQDDEAVSSEPRTMAAIATFLRAKVYLSQALLRHTLHVIKKNKTNYTLGFAACFLVVFVVALVVTIIGNTPVVFLRLAEMQIGEIDLEVTGGLWDSFLNHTLITDILQKDTQFTYHTPRTIFNAEVVSALSCDPSVSPTDSLWKYHNETTKRSCSQTCFNVYCPGPSYLAEVFIIDTEKEKKMGLGREWALPPLQPGHAYVQRSLANSLGVGKGDIIYVSVSAYLLLGVLWSNADSLITINRTEPLQSYVYLTVTIDDTFSDSGGKYGSSVKNGIIFEYGPFMQYFLQQMDPLMDVRATNYLKQIDLYQYAQLVCFNLPPPRIQNYINSNQDVIQYNVVQITSQILYRIGFNLVHSELPILSKLYISRIVSLFLGLILNVIIFILLFLSILLIYSLMMINVETRTFELGVMRMIGATRSGIIQLLLFQAFSYSLPSWVLGLVAAQFFAVLVSNWFENLTGVPVSPLLTSDSILLSTALGLLIPIAASVFPIRNALGKNLNDSLDVKRSKSQAVQISMERSEDSTFSASLIIVGVCLAVFGFGIYYVFPLSLLSLNLSLMLNMFFFLLVGMLLGLVLLSLNVQHLLERIVVWVFLWWEKVAIPQVVLKNLIAHRLRNRKTAVMYALSLGFIIFISVTYELQMATLKYSLQQENGVFLKVQALGTDGSGRPYTISRVLVNDLEALSSIPTMASFAWVSAPLAYLNKSITLQEISNIGHLFTDSNHIYGVSPTLFTTTIPGFLNVGEVADDPDFNLASDDTLLEQLYTAEGSKSMVLGSVYQDYLGLSIKAHSHLLVETTYSTNSPYTTAVTRDRLKPMAFLDSAPVFKFSQYPSILGQDALVSFTTYVRLSHGAISSVQEIPMSRFLIKLADGATNEQIDALKARLQTVINAVPHAGVSIWDYRDEESPLVTASVVISYFFDFTTVVAMAISFFSLMSSMFTNVYEQTKEIGILRAVGIPKFWMYRIYIYEAFVLVLSSSLLGILIGTFVGFTVVLQQVLFTQLPIPMAFPYNLLVVVFACSLVFSVIASFGPIRVVLGRPIVNILRGGY